MKKVESLLAWFRRNYRYFENDIAWCNISKTLTFNEVERLKHFCLKRSIDFLVIVNGVNPLRPQRTCGCLPSWCRNNTVAHSIYKDENAFVFASRYVDAPQADKQVLFNNIIALASEANATVNIYDFRKNQQLEYHFSSIR